jgi:hypothetical protein
MSAFNFGFTGSVSQDLLASSVLMQGYPWWFVLHPQMSSTPSCDVCTVARNGLRIYDEQVPDTRGADKFRAASRVIGRRAGTSRWSRATYSAGRSFLGTARHVVHVLFHQVTGLFFLLFGLVLGLAFYREYHAYEAGRMGPGRAILSGVLGVLFLYFSISNFVRAGRKRK